MYFSSFTSSSSFHQAFIFILPINVTPHCSMVLYNRLLFILYQTNSTSSFYLALPKMVCPNSKHSSPFSPLAIPPVLHHYKNTQVSCAFRFRFISYLYLWIENYIYETNRLFSKQIFTKLFAFIPGFLNGPDFFALSLFVPIYSITYSNKITPPHCIISECFQL